MQRVEFTVTEDEAGSRLDVFLVAKLPVFGRRGAVLAISNGDVRVHGRRKKKSYVVVAGDVVAVSNPPTERLFHARPNTDLELDVVFEDADLVVVNKPAGQPTHPLHVEETETLANALVAKYPEMSSVGYDARQPGVVHRLDNDTSGLLLAARTTRAFQSLRNALVAGEIEKHYCALVEGNVSEGRVIRLPIAPHPRDKKRVLVATQERNVDNGSLRQATTTLVRAVSSNGWTLLTVSAPTARRHQIRAHLAAIGHPLAGDLLYGGPAIPALNRHFLHASTLSFEHPFTGKPMRFRAPLPHELTAALRDNGIQADGCS